MKTCGDQFFIILLFCFASLTAWSQTRQPAYEMNERLGRGINMGNSFEAPTEIEWGNPWKPEYFRVIAELGFDHVRLPVRWETAARSMSDAPYTINPDFMERIQEVVDTALKYKLHIIVNMHHHDSLYENPEEEKARFLSQWSQIAQHFQDYPDSLLFEVLNEPHGNLSPELWNEYFTEGLAEIRETNPTRVVLMGVAEYGGLGGIVHLELPADDYIILSPHYYNPFNFTHQGADWVGEQSEAWLGTEWLDTEADRETVENEFRYALQFSEEQHIPIHVGEFGTFSEADIDSRERWTTFLARWFEEQDFSWAYWEFSAGFGIYDPVTEDYNDPLVDALLHNEMPEPVPIYATPVYTSDFTSGTDGWLIQTQGTASGSLAGQNGNLTVTIDNAGSEAWHIQLVKNNILFENGKTYRISFNASASENKSATFYTGKATDPWNAYSGYNGISLVSELNEFVFSFEMSSPTDPIARLVFDLGTTVSDVVITDVKVEELSFVPPHIPVTSVDELLPDNEVDFFPNPINSVLYLKRRSVYDRIEIADLNGRIISEYILNKNTTSINLNGLPEGIYLLRLSIDNQTVMHKLIKE